MPLSYTELLQQAYEFYEKLEPIRVPALNGMEVTFTRAGFGHLLRKERRLRSMADRIRRLKLVLYIPDVLLDANAVVKYSSLYSVFDQSFIEFWRLTSYINGKKVSVVIAQSVGGIPSFLSIMD